MEMIVEWTLAYRDGQDICRVMTEQIRKFLG